MACNNILLLLSSGREVTPCPHCGQPNSTRSNLRMSWQPCRISTPLPTVGRGQRERGRSARLCDRVTLSHGNQCLVNQESRKSRKGGKINNDMTAFGVTLENTLFNPNHSIGCRASRTVMSDFKAGNSYLITLQIQHSGPPCVFCFVVL